MREWDIVDCEEDEDIWGEEPEAEVNEEIDEEEILLISDDFVVSFLFISP